MMFSLLFNEAFAASSASSFPRMPTWLGTQQNIGFIFQCKVFYQDIQEQTLIYVLC